MLKVVKVVPVKYLDIFWRTLKMLLINFQINLILTWSTTCPISNAAGAIKFAMTGTNLMFQQ